MDLKVYGHDLIDEACAKYNMKRKHIYFLLEKRNKIGKFHFADCVHIHEAEHLIKLIRDIMKYQEGKKDIKVDQDAIKKVAELNNNRKLSTWRKLRAWLRKVL